MRQIRPLIKQLSTEQIGQVRDVTEHVLARAGLKGCTRSCVEGWQLGHKRIRRLC